MTRLSDPDLAEPIPTCSLLEEAAGDYHATLLASGTVLESIKWRGAVGGELVEHFRLGYSDGTLAMRAKSDPARQRALIQLGLLRRSGQERFAGTLVVPVIDAAGRVVALCGGAYHVATERNTKERTIPKGSGAVFHLSGFFLGEELIVASSALTALRFWYAGHVSVTAAAEGLTLGEAHLAQMKAAGTRRVLLALDASPAGDRAALSAAQRLSDAGIDAYRVPLARRFMPTSQQWGRMIREAQPMLGAPPRPRPPPLELDWKRSQPNGARP